ncbi:hypothetical protein AG1IA_07833 [Rhizoctonia solani AG-1 IA]|uniref:Uncharacterized protein n=1 Tax=Thanatephorus cucumeris (strain AG1-IA) TaxID=983506 RepID=L8WN17_THACA|nr:hypothetical protein AG1IA_07833 [Rhizoctonia solani AG-1 IA]
MLQACQSKSHWNNLRPPCRWLCRPGCKRHLVVYVAASSAVQYKFIVVAVKTHQAVAYVTTKNLHNVQNQPTVT